MEEWVMMLSRVTGLIGLLTILTFLGSEPVNAQGGGDQLDAGLVNPGYVEKPAWFKDSFLDIRDDISEAAQANKRIMLYFYQDGCPYCEKLIKENMSQQQIVEKMKKDFDVISINMWGDREVTGLDGKETTEKNFAVANKIMFTPTLVFLDENGGQVLRLNGYVPPHKFITALNYAHEKQEKLSSFRDYLAKSAVVAGKGKLNDDPAYMKPPFDFSKRDSARPLVVMFEQKNCPPCDELHDDILWQDGSQVLLEKFDVALLDTWSKTPVVTPAGKNTTVEEWGRELKITYVPSMVFFVGGKEVFRTEGWLRTFHVQSALDYVSSGEYRNEKEFQRYVEHRADALRKQSIEVDLMK
jgi:thioredoxin-related protein